jgi:hypothetical protein
MHLHGNANRHVRQNVRCNAAMQNGADWEPSYAGLTRVSINLQRVFSKGMDCRVKPGNDGVLTPHR